MSSEVIEFIDFYEIIELTESTRHWSLDLVFLLASGVLFRAGICSDLKIGIGTGAGVGTNIMRRDSLIARFFYGALSPSRLVTKKVNRRNADVK